MIQVRRKEKETPENMVRRFTRRVQQSGVLLRARRTRFRVEEKSKTMRRREALYKIRIRREIDRLKKMGKFDDDALKDLKRKMN
ncbi:MAG: hypothetical protein KC736_02720 [Candidatus Moranbacteria bacterium]|nr:hypothetical protein [Candidatus Moranbacteria bacterium]